MVWTQHKIRKKVQLTLEKLKHASKYGANSKSLFYPYAKKCNHYRKFNHMNLSRNGRIQILKKKNLKLKNKFKKSTRKQFLNKINKMSHVF